MTTSAKQSGLLEVREFETAALDGPYVVRLAGTLAQCSREVAKLRKAGLFVRLALHVAPGAADKAA